MTVRANEGFKHPKLTASYAGYLSSCVIPAFMIADEISCSSSLNNSVKVIAHHMKHCSPYSMNGWDCICFLFADWLIVKLSKHVE